MNVSIVLPKVMLPTVIRALSGYKLSCPVAGSPPVYTAFVRNFTVLENTSYTATISLNEQGNYSCVATNKYGVDAKNFYVVFKGKCIFQQQLFLSRLYAVKENYPAQ